MNTPNPVTPAPAAAPGTNEPVNDNSNVVTSAPSTAEGKEPKINNDGTNVTIPISEYKNLNRSNARLKSLQKRNALGSSKQTLDTTKSYDNADPDVVEELQKGYKFYDRVVRPSRVVVGNGEGGEEENDISV